MDFVVGFYHQAILMSGTDLSLYGFLEPYWRPREYAKELAELLGCPTHHSYDMLQCLRNNSTLSWQRFRDAQKLVKPKVQYRLIHYSTLIAHFYHMNVCSLSAVFYMWQIKLISNLLYKQNVANLVLLKLL